MTSSHSLMDGSLLHSLLLLLIIFFIFYKIQQTLSDPPKLTSTLSDHFVFFSTIRIEFNHSNLDYFTEIDAVLLTGFKCNPVHLPKFITLANKCNERRRGPISRKLESVHFKPIVVNADVIIDFLVNDFESFIIESGMVDDEDQAQFTLKDFPV